MLATHLIMNQCHNAVWRSQVVYTQWQGIFFYIKEFCPGASLHIEHLRIQECNEYLPQGLHNTLFSVYLQV